MTSYWTSATKHLTSNSESDRRSDISMVRGRDGIYLLNGRMRDISVSGDTSPTNGISAFQSQGWR